MNLSDSETYRALGKSTNKTAAVDHFGSLNWNSRIQRTLVSVSKLVKLRTKVLFIHSMTAFGKGL